MPNTNDNCLSPGFLARLICVCSIKERVCSFENSREFTLEDKKNRNEKAILKK